jgi:hypothetical protein
MSSVKVSNVSNKTSNKATYPANVGTFSESSPSLPPVPLSSLPSQSRSPSPAPILKLEDHFPVIGARAAAADVLSPLVLVSAPVEQPTAATAAVPVVDPRVTRLAEMEAQASALRLEMQAESNARAAEAKRVADQAERDRLQQIATLEAAIVANDKRIAQLTKTTEKNGAKLAMLEAESESLKLVHAKRLDGLDAAFDDLKLRKELAVNERYSKKTAAERCAELDTICASLQEQQEAIQAKMDQQCADDAVELKVIQDKQSALAGTVTKALDELQTLRDALVQKQGDLARLQPPKPVAMPVVAPVSGASVATAPVAAAVVSTPFNGAPIEAPWSTMGAGGKVHHQPAPKPAASSKPAAPQPAAVVSAPYIARRKRVVFRQFPPPASDLGYGDFGSFTYSLLSMPACLTEEDTYNPDALNARTCVRMPIDDMTGKMKECFVRAQLALILRLIACCVDEKLQPSFDYMKWMNGEYDAEQLQTFFAYMNWAIGKYGDEFKKQFYPDAFGLVVVDGNVYHFLGYDIALDCRFQAKLQAEFAKVVPSGFLRVFYTKANGYFLVVNKNRRPAVSAAALPVVERDTVPTANTFAPLAVDESAARPAAAAAAVQPVQTEVRAVYGSGRGRGPNAHGGANNQQRGKQPGKK